MDTVAAPISVTGSYPMLTGPELGELNRKLSSIIWILKSSRNTDGLEAEHYWTGFSVSNKGLVMTTVSGYFHSKSGIKARRLDMEGFDCKASIVHSIPSWDIMLLKVEGQNDCKFVKFPKNVSLIDGEPLVSIAHPGELVGSCLVGRACYRCTNDVTIPPFDDPLNCTNYAFSSELTTPLYRQMGQVWNVSTFFKYEKEEIMTKKIQDPALQKYKKFHPLLPIIQCHGFQFNPNCSGAPVFNIRGDIVGMLNSSVQTMDIALHGNILKEFMQVVRRNALAAKKDADLSKPTK